MAVKVFISYSSEDAKRVKPIKDALKYHPGLEIFYADESFFPGDNIPSRIKSEIDKCDYLFLFHSKNSQKSQWVQNEVGIAIGKNKSVVPILLDERKPEGILKTNINYLDLTNKSRFNNGLKSLFYMIERKEIEKDRDVIILIITILALIGLILLVKAKS